jgi:NAD+ synthase
MRQLDFNKLCSDIQNWIKIYLHTTGLGGVVVGLSGGIDSAVTTALSVNAIGKKNVITVGLPCESMNKDLEDAKLVAESLGVRFYTIDLSSAYKELLGSLPSQIEKKKISLSNIKPRLRMLTLYFIAQSMGYIVGGTGNRTEIAIGYFTKYGDIELLNVFLH